MAFDGGSREMGSFCASGGGSGSDLAEKLHLNCICCVTLVLGQHLEMDFRALLQEPDSLSVF